MESRSKGSHHATLMSLQYENRLQALLEEESYDLSWVSARLHSGGGSKVMEAEAAPAEYNAKKLVAVFRYGVQLQKESDETL